MAARKQGPKARWKKAAGAALAAFFALGSPSCSLLVDSSASQCASDGDCARFPGTRCVSKACVSNAPPECSSTQQCVDTQGEFHICRKADQRCAPLLTAECTTVEGDYRNDNAVFIGSILPTTGPDSSMGRAMENSARMAVADFSSVANGLPPRPGTSGRRPLVLVGCSDNSSGDTGVKAAKHLAGTVGTPAILGAAFSGITIKIATDVTIPGGVLLLSPSATSVAISDLPDNGLVWRTAPSDLLQSSALALLVPLLEAEIRVAQGMGADQPLKLAIAHKGDAYGRGLGNAIEKILQFNGKSALANGANYLRVDYGDPGDGVCEQCAAAVTKVLGLAPHIVLDFGTNEAVTQVFQQLEKQWPAQVSYRAHYLFSDGGQIQELSDFIGSDNALRRRIRGTVPGTNNILYKSFRTQYLSKFGTDPGPDVFGTAGSYDGLYLLAYATVALQDKDLTGANLAEALKMMVPPGPQIDVGADKINAAVAPLSAGTNIDFNGASGPLDFNVATGEAPSDIQIWCVPKDANGFATAAQNSGLFYNSRTDKLEGTVGAECL